MITEVLQEIGLSKKEAEVYTKLLELGSQSAAIIGKQMQTARSTAQFILNSLVEKSFVKKAIKNKITYYSPEKPETIKKILDIHTERFQEEMRRKKERLDLIYPLLNQINKIAIHVPKINFYEGVDNVIESYKEFLSNVPENDTIFNYVSPAPAEYSKFRNGMKKFIDTRMNKNVFCKVICVYGEDAIRLKLTDKTSKRETLMSFEKPHNPFFSEILLSKNKVLDTSYSPHGIFSSLMTNNDIAAMRINVFKMAWKQAKKDDNELMRNKEVDLWIKKLQGITKY